MILQKRMRTRMKTSPRRRKHRRRAFRRLFWLLVLAGFTPIPLKIFTWASGIVGVPMLPCLAAMLVGRGKRVYLLALVIRLGGERAERALHRWIEHLGWAAMVLFAALVSWLLLRGPAA